MRLPRPLAQSWLHRAQWELDLVPRPLDAPRQSAAGPDADRVLLLGSGPAIGYGVRTHELAVPGHLSRRLADATGRGAEVDVVARRDITVETAAAHLEGLRLWRYDGVVVIVGASDAYGALPMRRWRAAVEGLVAALQTASSVSTEIVLVGIHPLQRSDLSKGWVGAIADRHAARLNAATAQVCATADRCTFLEVGGRDAGSVVYRTPAAYALLADRIAGVLAPRLDRARTAGGDTPRLLRDRPHCESERQAALDALEIVGTEPEERFDRLARFARELFGTRFAAISLLDGERQWNKSAVGLDRELPRALSLCERTIRHDRAVVIPDLEADPETPDGVLASGVRFYAGYPLESPDGYRLGSLCLLDTEPHAEDSFDTEALHTLALRVQRELWTDAAGRMRVGA